MFRAELAHERLYLVIEVRRWTFWLTKIIQKYVLHNIGILVIFQFCLSLLVCIFCQAIWFNVFFVHLIPDPFKIFNILGTI